MFQFVKNIVVPDNIIQTVKDLIDTLKTLVPFKEFGDLLDSIVHYIELVSHF